MTAKLGIGTAQFGLDYGISNRQGQTGPAEVARILQTAAEHQVESIDTAPAYGSSEEALGAALPVAHKFRIVTKTPRLRADDPNPGETLSATFLRSLSSLRQSSVYGLLFHEPADLLGRHASVLFVAAQRLKQEGLVRKIGISVYTGAEIDAINSRFPIDLVQAPVNVFDQRLIAGGQLKRLKAAGVEVHARSAFLQGLLLMEANELPAHFDSIREHVRQYRAWLKAEDLAPARAALQFVTGIAEVDCVLCGVNDAPQFRELVASFAAPLSESQLAAMARFAITDERILNPSNWTLAAKTS